MRYNNKTLGSACTLRYKIRKNVQFWEVRIFSFTIISNTLLYGFMLLEQILMHLCDRFAQHLYVSKIVLYLSHFLEKRTINAK